MYVSQRREELFLLILGLVEQKDENKKKFMFIRKKVVQCVTTHPNPAIVTPRKVLSRFHSSSFRSLAHSNIASLFTINNDTMVYGGLIEHKDR